MKSSNTIRTRVGILLLVCVILTGFAGLWWIDGTAAVDTSDTEPLIFVVERGEGVKSIASRLARNNLIRSPTGFYVMVKLLGIERSLQAGDFRLNPAMDAKTVARELTRGIHDVWVTTLEGWRIEEVAAKVAKELNIPEGEFLKYAREGYMFPDTYLIPKEASPAAIAEMMRENFNRRVSDVREDLGRSGLTFEEVVVLASIVEREGRTNEDRPVIAGILLKRLEAGWPLQTDATIQYALGYQPMEKTWWKGALYEDDKTVVSPFNTYRTTGLPPAPISNPGLSSILSVLRPTDSDYWYYLHDPQGGVHYAETIEEHNANITNYLR